MLPAPTPHNDPGPHPSHKPATSYLYAAAAFLRKTFASEVFRYQLIYTQSKILVLLRFFLFRCFNKRFGNFTQINSIHIPTHAALVLECSVNSHLSLFRKFIFIIRWNLDIE